MNFIVFFMCVFYCVSGVCLDHQEPCSYGERDCFDRVSERCDGVWNCPVHGGDERGCGK